MDNGHNSSMVPKTMDNGHNSSSVPSGSGHYNEDATLVDDDLLTGGKRSKDESREGATVHWSSATAGNTSGESAILTLRQVFPTKRAEHQQSKASDSTTTPSFCAALLSPKTTAMGSKSLEVKFQIELSHPTMDNGHNSSSVPSDSGHYNEDATLVDDALLKQDRRGDKRGRTATNWSSAAVGNILGKSAPTPAENVPIATERASATNASIRTTLPSFYATLLSPKLPKDTMPQSEPAAGRPT